jgi:hypothetical protein
MPDLLATVSEIFLNEPGVVRETAPSSVTLEVYMGLKADRGTYVIPGLGNPSTYDFENSFILDNEGNPQYITPQPFDWFINLLPTDPTYLTVFQLDSNGQNWNIIFKVIPNIFSQNTVLDFTMGQASHVFYVPKESLRLEQLFGDQTDTSSFSVFRIPTAVEIFNFATWIPGTPLDLTGIEQGQYVFSTTTPQFLRMIADSESESDLQSELSINFDIDIEAIYPATPYPTTSSFVVGVPFSDEDYYVFPITIVAAELTESGFVPITGERIVHTTISVV